MGKVVVLVSSKGGSGKSTIAVGLATAFANSDKKVLLIDADMRKPSVHKKLRISNEKGLSSILVGFSELEESVATINPNSKRKCKPAKGVYLMEQVETPGVLIECGFLSNPEEEAKLRSDTYQKSLCCVIASSISSHFDP